MIISNFFHKSVDFSFHYLELFFAFTIWNFFYVIQFKIFYYNI